MANKFFNSKTFYILASVFFAIVLFFNANATSIRNQGTNQSGGVEFYSNHDIRNIKMAEGREKGKRKILRPAGC